MMLNMKEDLHIHCNYNDHSSIDLTIPNIINKSESIGLERIAITEHVRKNSEWTKKYIDEIDSYIPRTKVKILKGFEAKILVDGEIDFKVNDREIKNLGDLIVANGKKIEINSKYIRPPKEFLKIFKECGVEFHLGSDAHAINDIGNFNRINDLINLIEEK